MKVAVATISFGNGHDRRTIYWFGQDGKVGQLYLENECLGEAFDCFLDDAREKVKIAYPKNIWDLEFMDFLLVI